MLKVKTDHEELDVGKERLVKQCQWKELFEMQHTEGTFKMSECSTVKGLNNACTPRISKVKLKNRRRETMFGEGMVTCQHI